MPTAPDPMDVDAAPAGANLGSDVAKLKAEAQGAAPQNNIPLFDDGDEFAGDDQDTSLAGAPPDDEVSPPGSPAPTNPNAAEVPAAPTGEQPATAGEPTSSPSATAPDAMPGDVAFDAWAAADPEGAKRYLDYMERENQAADAAASAEAGAGAEGGAPLGLGDPAEQAINVRMHVTHKRQEYKTAERQHNAAVDTFEADEAKFKEYSEAAAGRRAEAQRNGTEIHPADREDSPVLAGWKQRLDVTARELSARAGRLDNFNAELARVVEANEIVDAAGARLAPYRELYVEMYSSGVFAKLGAHTYAQQEQALRAELTARGVTSAKPAEKPVSEATKRYRALRAKTAPDLKRGHSAAAPDPNRQPGAQAAAAAGKDGVNPNLHPALAAVVKKIQAK